MSLRLPKNFNKKFQFSQDGKSLTISDLEDILNKNPSILRGVLDKRVCLHGSPFHIIQWLILLYGYADQIFISNIKLTDEEAELLIKNYDPELIISDANFLPNQWSNIPALQLDKIFNQDEIDGSDFIENLETRQTAIVLSTSGTTNTPKLVSNSLEGLIRTISRSENSKNLIWGLFYEPSRFAGLQIILQSLFGGGKLLLGKSGQSLDQIIDFYADMHCNAISATPSLWKKLCMSPNLGSLPLKQITLGGEIVEQNILDLLSKKFPASRIVHIYASTEAGTCLTVTDKKEGFPSAWLDREINGIKFKISGESTLCFFSKSFKQEYLKIDTSIYQEKSWIDSGDLVEVIDDRVYFKGRLNGAINVGGNKVLPEEVEGVISKVEGVLEVMVSSKKSSILGSLVTATVKIDKKKDRKDIQTLILKKCKSDLESYKVPSFIRFTDEINLSSGFKIIRNG